MAASESEDIFLVGFPKSGITWLQTLLAGLFYRIDLTGIHDTLVQDLIPDVEDRPTTGGTAIRCSLSPATCPSRSTAA